MRSVGAVPPGACRCWAGMFRAALNGVPPRWYTTDMARVQVTVDPELEEAIAELGGGVPRSRAIRDLALRGAADLRAEQARRAEALAALDQIATGEDDGFDFAVSAALHGDRR